MWGRNINVSFQTKLLCLLLFSITPGLVFYYINVALYCNYDLFGGIPCVLTHLSELNLLEEIRALLISFNIVIWWTALQTILAIIPDIIHKYYTSYNGGTKEGLISPGGYTYKYNINGLQAWLISVTLFILCSWPYN